ncbi:hypothetical protein [Roseimicrobium sp. ORNL1]|uniref:hypothetical protein n=1 Tax=Roseimicrobium sp. ORNL1 TaxID=2711231 RepID=UPI0013E140F0|nr:hypothetical protein [Roseimicrobium sp. ORNL1]QIF02858.1 hypothetical protein G5S37_15455 [Roseimicrobium sp. ORNL1]
MSAEYQPFQPAHRQDACGRSATDRYQRSSDGNNQSGGESFTMDRMWITRTPSDAPSADISVPLTCVDHDFITGIKF